MCKLDVVWIFATWVISLVIPTILATQNHNPIWLLITVGCVISFVGGFILWNNYLKKE
jgi:drug/metabolite transporter (DMT)-like permease